MTKSGPLSANSTGYKNLGKVGYTLKQIAWGFLLAGVALGGVRAEANLPLDLDVSFERVTPTKEAWTFFDLTSTSSRSWKHVILSSSSESSRRELARLNPLLNYCCTMNDWSERTGVVPGIREILASDLECKEYPHDGNHSVSHLPNSGCRFHEF